MTSSNRTRFAAVREATPGVTPSNPRLRKLRFSSVTPKYTPTFVDSDAIRDDRMSDASIKVFEESTQELSPEFHYPVPGSTEALIIASAMFNDWIDTPARDNDGVSGSAITAIGSTVDTLAFADGPAFVAGHLVRLTGFTVSGTNGLWPVTTGGTSSLVSAGAAFVEEANPPASAAVKVVGFQGAAGDIEVTANGLASTVLDFTTLGLRVGAFIKLGGTGAAYRFATAANNAWVRIVSITARALTLDHLPPSWAADDGGGKTIRGFIGDWIQNGTRLVTMTTETGYLGQAAPTYIIQRGLAVNQLNFGAQSKQKLTLTASSIGLGGEVTSISLDNTPDEPPGSAAYPVFAANVNIGQLNENGARVRGPNFVKEFSLVLNNNLTGIEAVDAGSYVAHREGESTVTGNLQTYFGSSEMLERFFAGTPTAINTRINKAGAAVIKQVPAAIYNAEGTPNVTGKNVDVMLPLAFKAFKDDLIGAHLVIQRFPYYEA